LFRIGATPAIIALVDHAQLILARNIVVGLGWRWLCSVGFCRSFGIHDRS
jgi:hypothetical protein